MIVQIVSTGEWNAWVLCFKALQIMTLTIGRTQVDFQYAVVLWSLHCPKTTHDNVDEVQSQIENGFGFL